MAVRPIAAAALAAGFFIPAVAGAMPRDRDHAGERYVVAESEFGHGTVRGPVRQSSEGWEVRLPGGTWIRCRRSCQETLRVETVDFWENQGRDRIDPGRGILGDTLRWSRSW